MSRPSDRADQEVTPAPVVSRARRALLPARMRAFHAPTWWHEVAILVVLDVVYERLRNLVPSHEIVATNRAEQVFRLTQRIHWDVELSINHWVASIDWLTAVCNYYYSFLNLPVTAGVLIWLFWRHPRFYRSARTVLVITTGIALTCFWLLPMAPPRLLHGAGFIDTLAGFHAPGSWGDESFAAHSNQFAAMPSLHCAWALWAGLCIFNLAKWTWLRRLGLVYPVCTLFVVVGTANHFVLDGVAGALVVALAFALHLAFEGQGVFERRLDRADLEARPVGVAAD